jgi:hypothetical protein
VRREREREEGYLSNPPTTQKKILWGRYLGMLEEGGVSADLRMQRDPWCRQPDAGAYRKHVSPSHFGRVD